MKNWRGCVMQGSIGLLCLLGKLAPAQVPNDRIAQRLELKINAAPFHSSTASCTVEWECLNKELTNSCLEYHNDQWFSFTPRYPGPYFVNVSQQACRDIRGVQLM